MVRVVNEINKNDSDASNSSNNLDEYDNSPSVNQTTSYTIENEGPSFFV